MASSNTQIDKPQRGRPKRAELLDVNINTASLNKMFPMCWMSVVLVCLGIPLGIGLVTGTDQIDICDGISSKYKEDWGDQFPNVTTEQTLTH